MALMFAPADTAGEAAVCRGSSIVIGSSPAVLRPFLNHERDPLLTRHAQAFLAALSRTESTVIEYLIHRGGNAFLWSVWRSPTDYYYGHNAAHKIAFGNAVMGSIGPETAWGDWIEGLASKIPGHTDHWDVINAASDANLNDVLDEARQSLACGD